MKRIFTWAIFIIIIGLIVWGLIAAQKKANRQGASLLLPDQIATSTDHIRGPENAVVTLVEYGDFQCPACGAYHPLVERVLAAEASSSVRFVFRHYPLSQHPNAIPAAMAAEAASRQGKFWEMYNILYDKQSEWESLSSTTPAFTKYAETIGLDLNKFAADLNLQSSSEKINNDYLGGTKAGINSTPTFFVNGKQIANPQGYDQFKKIIDDAFPKAGL